MEQTQTRLSPAGEIAARYLVHMERHVNEIDQARSLKELKTVMGACLRDMINNIRAGDV